MTLMPSDADYAEVMAALMGVLVAVPWQRPYTLPTATVACTWREVLGPAPLEQLRDLVLPPSTPSTATMITGRSACRWVPGCLPRSTGCLPGPGHPGEPGRVRLGRAPPTSPRPTPSSGLVAVARLHPRDLFVMFLAGPAPP